MSARIIVGDCLDLMPTLDVCSVDAIVCDPPYHLTTGKRGGTGIASDNPNSPAGRARISTGFMGKAWDGGDIAHRPDVWIETLRVAKPGAHLLAFGGTRTHHRLMCAIEDAGWELRDTLGWLFGSGFPKSHNGPWGGTALKPAWEPIVLARKPLIGTVAANVLQHGTGGLNIDDCRIQTGDDLNGGAYSGDARQRDEYCSTDAAPESTNLSRLNRGIGEFAQPLGRWPANILHDGSDEVLAVFPDEAGASAPVLGTEPTANGFSGAVQFSGMIDRAASQHTFRGDSGSAARFFYCPKADRADRNTGCEHMQSKPLNWSSGEQSPGTFQSPKTDRSAANHHPTVKPTELMRYLCRLITPPGGLILDPFAGSGSTGKAALLEGFRFIGIELSEEYATIARARIYASAPLFAETAA